MDPSEGTTWTVAEARGSGSDGEHREGRAHLSHKQKDELINASVSATLTWLLIFVVEVIFIYALLVAFRASGKPGARRAWLLVLLWFVVLLLVCLFSLCRPLVA